MMIAPIVLAIGLGAAFLGLLGYVHHDGYEKGYRTHVAEVAAEVREANRRVAEINNQAIESIAKAAADREAAIRAANDAPLPAGPVCELPDALRTAINRINRR